MLYKYTGKETVNLPTLGVTVNSGQTVESPVEINNPNFELVTGQPTNPIPDEVVSDSTEEVPGE